MDWTAISSISEVIAAGAVAMTFVYLAIQTHQNNKVLRAKAVWDAQNSFVEINETLADGGLLSELFFRAINDPENFTEYEKYLVQRYMRSVMQRVEAQFALYTNGVLDDEIWQLRRIYIKSLMGSALMQELWRLEKQNSMFTKAFIKEIDTAHNVEAPVFLGQKEKPTPEHKAGN